MKALLDTSILLLCAEKGRDYLAVLEKKIGDVIEPVVLESVLRELKALSGGRGKKAKLARAAAEMLTGVEVVEAEGAADEALIKYSSDHGIPVVSVDLRLLRRLSRAGLPYITVSKAGKPIVRLILR